MLKVGDGAHLHLEATKREGKKEKKKKGSWSQG